MNETTFENAKVGDRVWSVRYGWGSISLIKKAILEVSYDCGGYDLYNFEGRMARANTNQNLFWDEIKIIAPPRPNRKVTKTVERWMNIYNDETFGFVHDTKEEAVNKQNIHCLACVKLTGSYEVEE